MTHIYEHPLNERLRLFLRLEYMLNQMKDFQNPQQIYDIQLFLNALFDVLGFFSRYEIRSELLNQLQSYKTNIEKNPDHKQSAFLKDLNEALSAVHRLDIHRITALRDNELFSGLRQRSFNQSGHYPFEAPAYQYWLQTHLQEPSTFFQNCFERFLPIVQALELLLHLTRETVDIQNEKVSDGVFLKNLDSKKQAQMLRLHLSSAQKVFPQISGDRHRISIRFMEQPCPSCRPKQTEEALLSFGLQVCWV